MSYNDAFAGGSFNNKSVAPDAASLQEVIGFFDEAGVGFESPGRVFLGTIQIAGRHVIRIRVESRAREGEAFAERLVEPGTRLGRSLALPGQEPRPPGAGASPSRGRRLALPGQAPRPPEMRRTFQA